MAAAGIVLMFTSLFNSVNPMNVLNSPQNISSAQRAASDGLMHDHAMPCVENVFRLQFFYLSPVGVTKAMEETTIIAKDLGSAQETLSRMRPWPCDADAARIVDAWGRARELTGRTAWEQAIIETYELRSATC